MKREDVSKIIPGITPEQLDGIAVHFLFNVGHIICQSSQTKIPEKLGAKPLFGDFTLELLIRFERTTCSLRAIKGTSNVLCHVVSLSNKLRDAIILFV